VDPSFIYGADVWKFSVVLNLCGVAGLVIIDAKYGPKESEDDAAKGLVLDVTIPLQALVNNSQLYVPGGRSKVSSGPVMLIDFISRCFFHSREDYESRPSSFSVKKVSFSASVEPSYGVRPLSVTAVFMCHPHATVQAGLALCFS
jgi:hypothetical protein